ncbi:DNA primase [Candidatus Gottesmanbacteria bacterium RIFCSPLOWO2_01_FULL_39_12b]|uniref:DNA primase n=1 Tax=Candidatus Gottesmanbacteria bacterium RIFCSPLOWO2_01_FULL_39_12b TaxID=1798388 RepID=A0A1F6AM02_9BACT|nr:MAG: DNA primase [Candidatus Gottesmanbacteria bacterium RIFCSPLOWO2_01_FULL_39_12b]
MTDVELVKSKIDIVNFLGDYITLKKAGRNFKALCPFHSEKSPSFIVSPERGSWHCFGACGEGGDAISFLQKWEGIEFLEALKILAKKTGVSLTNYAPSDTIKLREKLYEINHLSSEFYKYLLTTHQLGRFALDYLKERGIKPEIVETFTLGYAPNSWDSLLRFLSKKGYSTPDIWTAGLLVKSDKGTYYDRFRGRLMFALHDPRGNIIGFSGRILDEKVYPESERGAKYINTSETPIYSKGMTLYGLEITKEAIKKKNEAVVVEGEFDLLSSFQSGVTNVVAIKGSALTEGQVLLLKRFSENLVLALDSDLAGNEAARRGIEIAENSGLSVRIVHLLYGKDPADCVAKSPHLWKDSIKQAVPVYDFVINTALVKFNKKEAIGKKKIGQEVVPYLSKITNPIVQSHYIKLLAKELEVGEESIETAIKQFPRKIKKTGEETATRQPQKRDELLEEHLLSIILQSDEVAKSLEDAFKIIELSDLKMVPVKKILELLLAYFQKQKKWVVKTFSPVLTPEISPSFDKALMIDLKMMVSNMEALAKDLHQTAVEIRKISLRRRISDFSTKMHQKEIDESDGNIEILNEEIRKFLKEIGELDKAGNNNVK